jgi:tetrahydromethanopterin S-methyltransferase subunit C
MSNIVNHRFASEAESVGAGALSGAAIASVVAIGITSASTMVVPVVGTIVGAALGAGVGHLVRRYYGGPIETTRIRTHSTGRSG